MLLGKLQFQQNADLQQISDREDMNNQFSPDDLCISDTNFSFYKI